MFYDKKELGARIKLLRKKHGFTQEQFSEMLNMTVNHLYKIEAGMRNVSIDLLVEIAAHFDTSLDYLVLGKETEIDQQKIRSAITLLSEIVQKM